ncbi:MAG: heme exporter protein CcmD [Pseudomonadota bacterium]
MNEFLAMGGYASYVWSAVSVSAVVIALNVWAAHRGHRQMLISLRRRAQLERDRG